MAYTPTEWQSGDIVTSAKLNKIENGIAGAGGGNPVVEMSTEDGQTYTCDTTCEELTAMKDNGTAFTIKNVTPQGTAILFPTMVTPYNQGGVVIIAMTVLTAATTMLYTYTFVIASDDTCTVNLAYFPLSN